MACEEAKARNEEEYSQEDERSQELTQHIDSFKTDWFYQKYHDKLIVNPYDPFTAGRFVTMQIAINLFLQRGGTTIVETGCQREKEDWGAGCSTSVFADVVSRIEKGRLFSIDNEERHLSIAREVVHNASHVEFIHSDSVEALRYGIDTQGSYATIDLLYLDSFDYPLFELCDRYGTRSDPGYRENPLFQMSDRQITAHNADLIGPCQVHCLNEVQFAYQWLTERSVILIDDANFPGGGKARLARTWLAEQGWCMVLDAHQTVWIRN